jgi:hypothetical protein
MNLRLILGMNSAETIPKLGLRPTTDVMVEWALEEEAEVSNGTLASLVTNACIVAEPIGMAVCPSPPGKKTDPPHIERMLQI